MVTGATINIGVCHNEPRGSGGGGATSWPVQATWLGWSALSSTKARLDLITTQNNANVCQ